MYKYILFFIFFPIMLYSLNLKDNILVLDTKIDQKFVQQYTRKKVYDSPKGLSIWTLDGNLKFYAVDSAQTPKILIWGGGNTVNDYQRITFPVPVSTPWGLASSSKDYIYMTDKDGHSMIFKKRKGSKIVTLLRVGKTAGHRVGEFNSPTGITVREWKKRDMVYVVEAGNNRLQAFLETAPHYIQYYKDIEKINFVFLSNESPMGVSVIVNDQDDYTKDKIIVSYTSGILTMLGYNFLYKGVSLLDIEKEFNLRTISPNASLCGIAIDKYKHIFVVDNSNNKLHILDSTLSYLFSYNLSKDGVWSPWYIDILKPQGMLAITWGGGSDGGGMVYWIGAKVFDVKTETGYFSPHSKTKNTARVSYRLFTPSSVTITVEDTAGRLITTLENQSYKDIITTDTFNVEWNGRDTSGKAVLPGKYKIRIRATATYGANNDDEAIAEVNVVEPLEIDIVPIYPNIIDNQNQEIVIDYTFNRTPVKLTTYVERKKSGEWETVKTIAQDVTTSGGSLAWDGTASGEQITSDGIYRIILIAVDNYGLEAIASDCVAVNLEELEIDNFILSRTKINPLHKDYNTLDFSFELSEIAHTRIEVSQGDELLKTINLNEISPGIQNLTYLGDDNNNLPLPTGMYKINIIATQDITGDSAEIFANLTIDSTSPEINILLQAENQYFSPIIDSPGIKDTITIRFKPITEEVEKLSVQIMNYNNENITNLYSDTLPAVGVGENVDFIWDGKDFSGQVVPDGEYYFQFRAADDVGNETLRHFNVVVDNNRELEVITTNFFFKPLLNISSRGVFVKGELLSEYVWNWKYDKIYYSADYSGARHLFMINSDGTGLKSLLVPLTEYPVVALSRDAEKLAVIKRVDDGSWKLFILSGRSGDVEKVINVGVEFRPINWSPDGKWLLGMVKNNNSWDLYKIDVAFSFGDIVSTIRLTGVAGEESSSDEKQAEFSRDGRKIAYFQNFANKSYLMVMDSNGGNKKIIKYRGIAGSFLKPLWAGKKIAYYYLPNPSDINIREVRIVDSETGTMVNISDTSDFASASEISPDEKYVYFGMNYTNPSLQDRLVRVDVETGVMETLFPTSGYVSSLEFFKEGKDKIVFSFDSQLYEMRIIKSVGENLVAKVNYPENQFVKGNLPIVGSASDKNFKKYSLYWKFETESEYNYRLISQSYNQVKEDDLGYLDTIPIPDGSEILIKLHSEDLAGNWRTHFVTNKVANYGEYILHGVGITKHYLNSNDGNEKIKFSLRETGSKVTIKLIPKTGASITLVNNQNFSSGTYQIPLGKENLLALNEGDIEFEVVASLPSAGINISRTGNFVLDKSHPIIVLDLEPDTIINEDNKNIVASVTDANLSKFDVYINNVFLVSKFQPLTNSIIWTIDINTLSGGLHHFKVIACDLANNTNMFQVPFNVDKTPPVATILFPTNNTIVNKTIDILGSVYDNLANNFAFYELYIDNVKKHSGNEVIKNGILYSFDTRLIEFGAHTLKLVAFDKNGNNAIQTVSFKVDNNPPESQAIVVNGWIYTNNNLFFANSNNTYGFRIVNDDKLSSFRELYYSIDNGPFHATSDTNNSLISFIDEGKHIISFYSVDELGNEEEMQQFSIEVDIIPPDVEMITENLIIISNIIYVGFDNSVVFNAIDDRSGVKTIEYSRNGKTYHPFTGEGVLLTTPGLNTVYYRAIDNVGNISSVKSNQIYLDVFPPITEVSYDKPLIFWNNTNYSLYDNQMKFTSLDFESGIKELLVSTNGGISWITNKSGNYSFMLKNAINEIQYYSIDNVGNMETMHEITIIAPPPDTTPPVTYLVLDGNYTQDGNTIYANSNVIFTLYAEDLLGEFDGYVSGVDYIEYEVDGNGWVRYEAPLRFIDDGDYNFLFRAVDNYGNIETAQQFSVSINNAVPEIKELQSLVLYLSNIYYEWETESIVDSLSYEVSSINTNFITEYNRFMLSNIDLSNVPLNVVAGVRPWTKFGVSGDWKSITNVLDYTLEIISPVSNFYHRKAVPVDIKVNANNRAIATISFGRLDDDGDIRIPQEWVDVYSINHYRMIRNIKQFIKTDWPSPKKESLEDGKYIVKMSYRDISGNEREDSRIIYIDNSQPYVDFYINQQQIGEGFVTAYKGDQLILDGIDPLMNGVASGIKDIWYSLTAIHKQNHIHFKNVCNRFGWGHGKGLFAGLNHKYGKYEVPITLQQGYYVLTVIAVDNAKNGYFYNQGNQGNKPWNDFEGNFSMPKYLIIEVKKDSSPSGPTQQPPTEPPVDETAPEIFITGVENGKYYNSEVYVEITIQDENLAGNKIFLNSQVKNDSVFTVSKEGGNSIEVIAWDSYGNTNTKALLFVIDRIKPDISVNGLDEASYINSVTFSYTVVDDNLDTVSAKLNGEIISGDVIEISEIGEYTLIIEAYDKAGNSNRFEKTFTVIEEIVDNDPPIITISGIADGGIVNHDVNIVITVEDEYLNEDETVAYINGQANSIINGVLELTITTEGYHKVKVFASDYSGNVSIAQKEFVIDKLSPEIIVKNISDGHRYIRVMPKIEVSDNISGDTNIEVNKYLVFNETNTVQYTNWVIDDPGSYTLIISAQDEAGNTATKNINFYIVCCAPKFGK
jgi:flagellar hook assembly protein FlgD